MDKAPPLFVVRVPRGFGLDVIRSRLQAQLEGVRTVVVLPEGVELVEGGLKAVGKARVCPSCGSRHIEVHADFQDVMPCFKWACFDCGARGSGSLPSLAQSNEASAPDMLKLPVIDQGKRLNEEELLAPAANPRREFFMAFANAVGIEPRNVTGLVVRLDPGLPFAQVEVTSIAPKGSGQAAAEVLQKFNLVARSEGDPQVVGSSDKSVSLMTSEETTHRVVGLLPSTCSCGRGPLSFHPVGEKDAIRMCVASPAACRPQQN